MLEMDFGGRMSGCKWCHHGIMILFMGEREIRAPCIQCSPTRKLVDLEREQALRDDEFQKEQERKEIREHNARMVAN
jgi:hypothetical protein